jgi:hypothetical protein
VTIETKTVVVRVTVDYPPSGPGVVFGLQDKSGHIVDGVPGPQGQITFEGEVRVTPTSTGNPNFLGPITHGPPTSRHLYLSHGRSGGEGWIKRIKLPLASITWEMINAASDGAISARVDGRSAATVRTEWRVV